MYLPNFKNSYTWTDYFKPDYFVLSGMFASQQLENSVTWEILRECKKKDIAIIFLGLGSQHYTKEEAESFRKVLDYLKPKLVITRDEQTYLAYKNSANCFNGIDCALWTDEVYDPRGFKCEEYYLYTFNYSKEPKELEEKYQTNVIRPIHHLWGIDIHDKRITKDGVFISDSPFDYLSLYANAKAVYTDMIHATLMSLMYGTPVKYYYYDKRSNVLDTLDTYKNGEFLFLDKEKTKQRKLEIEQMVKKIISS